MTSAFQFSGFAIVSREGMIADAAHAMPQSLKWEADHLFFEKALGSVDLIVHGKHSHEYHADSDNRRRFWLTRSVGALAPDPRGGLQWLWNPEGIGIEDAAREIGLAGGRIAVLGGTSVYDMFLPRYDVFHLSRAGKSSIPGGTPVFSAVDDATRPEDVLAARGLAPEPTLTLDAENEVSMTRWLRRA